MKSNTVFGRMIDPAKSSSLDVNKAKVVLRTVVSEKHDWAAYFANRGTRLDFMTPLYSKTVTNT